MVVHPELHTAYIWLTKEDLERFSHVKGDTEGFANVLLTMKGVVLSVLFIERTGFVKMSLAFQGELQCKCPFETVLQRGRSSQCSRR
ncbi:MAG: hypothetical protein MZV63_23370 [Marinilabiliales bacterium]|nr:hypothetical protein [Marinilabiliales bacterium]